MWKYSYTQIGSEQFWAIQVDNTRKLPSNLLLSSTQRNQERSHTFSLISKLFGDSRYTHWLQKLWINPKIPEKFLLLPLPFSFWVFLLITFSVSSFTWSCPADLCSSQSASASSPLESVWTRKAWDTTHSLSFNTTVTSNAGHSAELWSRQTKPAGRQGERSSCRDPMTPPPTRHSRVRV